MEVYSSWRSTGNKTRSITFLIMVNDLIPATDLVKFVDDSTTWEVLHRDSQSNLPSAVKACEECRGAGATGAAGAAAPVV